MGDDPYDFEIAFPAAPNSASRSTRKHRNSSGSDDDGSDASGGLSSMSSISSDSEHETDHKRQYRTESSFNRAPKSFNDPKGAASGAVSSGSALDKARSFLSKYSSATKDKPNGSDPPNSSRSRRISLELDDEDEFSAGSSSGDDGIRSKSAIPVNLSGMVVPSEQDSASRHSSESPGFFDKSADKQPMYTSVHYGNEVNGESSQISGRLLSYSSPQSVTAEVAARDDEHSSDDSQIGDSIESFHSGASDERSQELSAVETPTVTLPKEDDQYHEESADVYDDSFQEESMGQSQTNSAVDVQPRLGTSNFATVMMDHSVASESGVYEEEVFEEDSIVATPAPTISSGAAKDNFVQQEDSSSAHDASSSYRDDEPDEQSSIPKLPITSLVDIPTKSDSSPKEDNVQIKTQSSLDISTFTAGRTLESETGVCEEKAESTVATPAPTISSGAAVASTLQGTRYEDTSSSHDDSSNHSGDKNDSLAQCARELGACNPTEQTKSESPPDPKSDKVTPSKYSHVTIVRDFEVDEEKRVEMRDASTQFTGNHASIQTDLVPDGMRNLLTATSTANRKSEVCPSNPEDVRVQRVPQPPPPPISSMFGSPMYSLDILKLPGTSSTSIYKQQLLVLQEQILQKKRETERIVHDRMTFQYSSSRGTERFLAARRTQKLELWEALMRVDPTLDEQKAREVARLSQAAST